jgi:hypothetical protein
MEVRISDLLNCIQDESIQVKPNDIASAERIKEATLKMINKSSNIKNKQVRRGRRKIATIILAAALVLTLSITALAAANILPYESIGEFFQAFFGNDSISSSDSDGVVEYDDYGKLKNNLPAWERVEVDESLADSLIGDNISAATGSVSWEGYTLSVEANLYDPLTGCGLAYYTLENPDGITGYEVFENGEIWFKAETIFTRTNLPSFLYLDSAMSSDTKLYICEYYINTGDKTLNEIQVELGEYLTDKEGAGTVQESVTIPVASADIPGITAAYSNNNAAIKVSPIGIRVDCAAFGLASDGYDLNYLALEYADGSRYVVLDKDGFLDNTCYAIASMEDSVITYSFNRIVHTNSIVKVIINGVELDI